MLFNLPAHPAFTLVSPDDTDWWTAHHAEPDGRHALVLADPITGREALIVAGPLPAVGECLGVLQRQAISALRAAAEYVPPSPFAMDGSMPVRAVEPAAALHPLPHTGIRLPDPDLRVTALRGLPTPDGIAYTATLRRGNTPIGTIVNDGTGGATRFQPTPGSPLGRHDLTALVAASRDEHGQPIAEEDLLEALITEYENTRHVADAARFGRSPVRLLAPIGPGGHHTAVYGAVDRTTAAPVTTPAQRAELIRALHRRRSVPGGRWQLWDGQRWDDLTPPQPTPAKPDQPDDDPDGRR